MFGSMFGGWFGVATVNNEREYEPEHELSSKNTEA
jgi:hypothetical protein